MVVRYYRARRQRIHMILDGAKYHKTALEWVSQNSKYIELHFLPAYSPNLNATEAIWQRTKRVATHNRYFGTEERLHGALFRRFNRYQGNPASLRGIVARWL
jgi:transposase